MSIVEMQRKDEDIAVLREQRKQSQAAYRAQLRDDIARLEAQRQGLHRTLALLEAQIAERTADLTTLEEACTQMRRHVLKGGQASV